MRNAHVNIVDLIFTEQRGLSNADVNEASHISTSVGEKSGSTF